MVKMMGAILPGNSTVELKEFDIPPPESKLFLYVSRDVLKSLLFRIIPEKHHIPFPSLEISFYLFARR